MLFVCVCLSVWLCLCVNHGGTNRTLNLTQSLIHYTQTLVILHAQTY